MYTSSTYTKCFENIGHGVDCDVSHYIKQLYVDLIVQDKLLNYQRLEFGNMYVKMHVKKVG